MEASVERIADDWIEFQRYKDVERAPEEVVARGWVLNDLAYDQPELAWAVIKDVIGRYAESDLSTESESEAQRILGMTAAGPIEDLLSYHGLDFIDRVEAEAKRDPRMSWTLGGVWQCGMSDDIFGRVERAAGGASYWSREFSRRSDQLE